VTSQKGVTGFPKELCIREGKDVDIFFVISITKWNHMHIGSAPRNDEPVIVC